MYIEKVTNQQLLGESEKKIKYKFNYRQYELKEKTNIKMTLDRYYSNVLLKIPKIGKNKTEKIKEAFSSFAELLEVINYIQVFTNKISKQDKELPKQEVQEFESLKNQVYKKVDKKTFKLMFNYFGF